MSMTLERGLEEIVAIASFTPMQTELETAGQMARIMRVAEEARAVNRAARAPSTQSVPTPGLRTGDHQSAATARGV